MYSTLIQSAILALVAVSSAAPQTSESRSVWSRQSGETPKAIYFMTNKENKENDVVSLKVGADGRLSDGSFECTGGKGLGEIDTNINRTAITDTLFSQSAVFLLDNMVFAVNPGSNTVSMMVMDPSDPSKLKMVGKPVDTLGEFPVSVAANADSKQVCVANSGAKNGLACAKFCADVGIGEMDTLRSFDLKQTTPPTAPANTVSHVLFNEAGTSVLTMVKGDPASKTNAGFMSSFKVQGGKVGTAETRSSPKGTHVLFGTAGIKGTNRLLTTDASFGAAILDVNAAGQATTKAMLKIPNQKATCWAAISEATGTGFVTDVGRNQVVEVNLKNGKQVNKFVSNNGNPGMIDLAASGNFVYALSPGNDTFPTAVTVFDVSGGPGSMKEIQNFKPKGLAPGRAMGMRVFSS